MKTLYYTLDSTQTAGGGQAVLQQLIQDKTNPENTFLCCPPGDLSHAISPYATYLPVKQSLLFPQIFELFFYLLKIKPNIIHTHSTTALPVTIAASFFHKIERRYSEHLLTKDYHLQSKFSEFIQKIFYIIIFWFTHKIYTSSRAVKEYLVNGLKTPAHKVQVRYNIVPYYAEKVMHSIHTPMKIISVGTVNYIKNFSGLINIAVLLRKKKLNFRLEIIGDGPLMEALKEQVAKYLLEDIVTLSGNLPHEEVMYKLLQSDIYVQTSLSESFGYSVAEAHAVGLPVVAYKVGGIPEVVTDEKSGYLISPYDNESFANAIVMLSKSVDLREKFGTFGRESLSRFR